jgi:hypothetical protein
VTAFSEYNVIKVVCSRHISQPQKSGNIILLIRQLNRPAGVKQKKSAYPAHKKKPVSIMKPAFRENRNAAADN